MTPQPKTWVDLAVDFGQEVSRRWLEAWGPYSQGSAQLLARSPVTRELIAELQARTSQDARAFFVTPLVTAGPRAVLRVDAASECAGPAFCSLPDARWVDQLADAVGELPRLVPIALTPDGAAHAPPWFGIGNIMLRIESNPQRSNPYRHRHILSVSLVDLPGASEPGRPPEGSFTLTFEPEGVSAGGAQPLPSIELVLSGS